MKVVDELEGDLTGKRIAIWGLTYKAGVSDTRGSTALQIAESLSRLGATVIAYDPWIQADGLNGLQPAGSALEACSDALALLVLTEEEIFRELDPSQVKAAMHVNPFVLDTRRVLDRTKWSLVFSDVSTLGFKDK
jgi:UDPglucose 6-dehydrogenase